MAGILVSSKRPRNLTQWHAGPLLFGDWGTSRLYVLGLAFTSLAFAAPYYLVALSLLMVAVAWAYTIVCRSFPDGGGVYSAARQISPLLSVIGATLLLADYIVTASLSMVDGFHYFGVPTHADGGSQWLMVALCAGTIFLLGVINWFGARAAGEFAKWVAVASIVFSAVIALLVLPWVPEGLKHMQLDHNPLLTRWTNFTGIILALSGVEAVANMTGIMKEPVARTSRLTIWPVLAEVATLNLVFGIALIGLIGLNSTVGADGVSHLNPGFGWSESKIEASAMKMLAIEGGQRVFGVGAGFVFGKAAAVVFGLLLISAANTVIGGMISVIYALGRDDELPKSLTRLNYSGVPKWPLLIACIAPVILLCIVHEVEPLANLYAIGVTGAISLNLACCAFNKHLKVNTAERAGLFAVAVVITAVFATIAVTKHSAALFAGVLVLLVLGGRWFAKARAARLARLPEPEIGWLAELRREPLQLDPSKPRIMLAARGRYQAEYAVDLARKKGATLFAIYVRTLRVMDYSPNSVPRIEEDPDAQEALGTVAVLARQLRIPFVPIYCSSPEVAEEILDYTVTYGCDSLIMGKSRRTSLARQLEGDVVSRVAAMLPEGVSLLMRDPLPHGIGPEAQPEIIQRGQMPSEPSDPSDIGHA